MVARVAGAAIASHPAWVIDVGKRQAETIINGGKSQHYAAARWLARARCRSRRRARGGVARLSR